MSFEQLFEEIKNNTTKMSETLDLVKKDTGRTLELTEQGAEVQKDAAKTIETEESRNLADTVPEFGAGGTVQGMGEVVRILKDIRGALGSLGGEGSMSGIGQQLVGLATGGKGKQTGGFVYRAPVQAFQNGGGVFKVPGSSTGDNHDMLLPQGSFVLNRNAAKALEGAGGFQNGGLVPTQLESQELVFGPGAWGGLIPALNKAIPRFQSGGVVPASHPDTGKGYSVGPDSYGRPSVFGKLAADAFMSAMQASGGALNPADITSSQRSEQKNKAVGGVPNSNHLFGNAVDIHGPSKAWLKENGPEYGWHNLVYSGHDGHFDFKGDGKGNKPKEESKPTGLSNLGANYKDQERILFEQAGGYTPYNAPSAFGSGVKQFVEPTGMNHNDFSHSFFDGFTSDVHSSGNSKYAKDNARMGDMLDKSMITNLAAQATNILTGGGLGMLSLLGSGIAGVMNAGNSGNDGFFGGAFKGLTDAVQGMVGGKEKGEKTAKEGDQKKPNSGGGDSASSDKSYDITNSIGFSKTDWDIYRNSVGAIESGNKYDIAGGSGGHYDGRWQLGNAAKTDAAAYLGEKYAGHGEAARKSFQGSPEMQERYFAAFTAKNHEYLTGHPKYDAMSTREKFEVLGYAHNQGAGGARQWLDTGVVGKGRVRNQGRQVCQGSQRSILSEETDGWFYLR